VSFIATFWIMLKQYAALAYFLKQIIALFIAS